MITRKKILTSTNINWSFVQPFNVLWSFKWIFTSYYQINFIRKPHVKINLAYWNTYILNQYRWTSISGKILFKIRQFYIKVDSTIFKTKYKQTLFKLASIMIILSKIFLLKKTNKSFIEPVSVLYLQLILHFLTYNH